MDEDDIRHRREEEARRAKRKEARENKSASQLEKEKRRKEHAQRVLNQQNLNRKQPSSKPRPPSKSPAPSSKHKSSSSSSPHTPHHSEPVDGSSKFQALFSKRAEGFVIDLHFRNAPPRPPVGPCFVGLGLDGELEKWTRYKPFNAIETNYSWKLHTESDLGVPLAPSAMDLETCYVDPSKPRKKQKHDYEDMFDDDDLDPSQNKIKLPPLHPDDAALINWKGSLGDTTAEQLQIRRDRARAAALLQGFNGGKNVSSSPSLLAFQQLRMNNQKGPKDFRSRVLNEQNPFFMKKTTYLANDQSQSVHNFKSLAQTKEMTVEEMEKMLVHSKKASEEEYIEETFAMTNNNNRPSEKRRHPSKRGVEAVYEIPLLPDVDTWGHVYTHVVLDNLPKKSSILSKLHNALIADVARGNLNTTRMECNLIIPQKNNATTTKLPTEYTIAQLYDLDVIPLKEDGAPHTNFLFVIDEEKQVASYHPIASRVQLSAGRPSQYSNDMDNIKTRLVSKRTLDEEEIAEIEGRKAEVDLDLAKKYGMIVEEEKMNDDDDYEGYGDNVRNQGDDGGNRRIPPFNTGDSSDSDEDAF